MYKFKSMKIANNFINRANKIWMLVHGDDGRFWVVTPREATRLQRDGYEIVR